MPGGTRGAPEGVLRQPNLYQGRSPYRELTAFVPAPCSVQMNLGSLQKARLPGLGTKNVSTMLSDTGAGEREAIPQSATVSVGDRVRCVYRLGHVLHRPVPPLCKPQPHESLGHPSGGGPPGALPGRSVARLERRCFLGKGVKGARGPPRPRACGRSRQGSTLPSSPRSILKDPSQWRKKKHTWGGMSCKKSSSNT